MPNSNKTAIVKSAMRTFAVLEFFRETKRAASVTEISSALEMPQSSTSVLLSSLVELNYLEYDRQTRRFIPSYRVNLLGDWIRRSPFRDTKLTDLMEELWTATGGETVMGLVSEQNNDHITLLTDPISGTRKTIPTSQIKSKEISPISMMPPGLINVLTKEEILDLLAYLESGGNEKAPAFAPAK